MILTDCPESRAGEWCFHLFGVEVRVKFWFWFATLLFCGNMDTRSALIWIAVCFVSILLHELGHVFAFRMFGTDAYAVLHGFGGLAVPDNGVNGTLANFVVALAGPMADFLLAALVVAVAYVAGVSVHFGWHMFLPTISAWPSLTGASGVAKFRDNYLWYVLLNDLLFVNFYWGLVNLLPVYPLDGGHAARAVFERRDRYNGKRTSLLVSAIVGALVALIGVAEGNLYMILLFGLLAATSAQRFEAERKRFIPKPRPYRSWQE
jgi:Zn-dependent protease